MPARAIERAWTSARFPSLLRFFRVNHLRAQVEAFDEIEDGIVLVQLSTVSGVPLRQQNSNAPACTSDRP